MTVASVKLGDCSVWTLVMGLTVFFKVRYSRFLVYIYFLNNYKLQLDLTIL